MITGKFPDEPDLKGPEKSEVLHNLIVHLAQKRTVSSLIGAFDVLKSHKNSLIASHSESLRKIFLKHISEIDCDLFRKTGLCGMYIKSFGTDEALIELMRGLDK